MEWPRRGRVTVDQFIAKWENCSGSERANYAVFLTELAGVLGVEAPGPNDDYRIDAPVPGGAEAGGTGFIDLYKRGCFILEAKQSKQICELPALPGLEDVSAAPSGAKYDELMRRAFRQARRYAQSLTQPPWPPFIIVLDVGRAFEIYFDYGGNGRDYRFFPDRLSYRIPISALRDPGIQHRMRAIWTDPKSIDPRFQSADVTRKVAMSLAQVSKYLEECTRVRSTPTTQREKAEEIEEAALFLMRILFCMFAEDVGLLPEGKFSEFLRRAESNDELFQNQLADLWQKMGAQTSSRALPTRSKAMSNISTAACSRIRRARSLSTIDIHRPLRSRAPELEAGRAGDLRDAAGTGLEPGRTGQARGPLYASPLCRDASCERPSWMCWNPNGRRSRRRLRLHEPSPLQERVDAQGERGEGRLAHSPHAFHRFAATPSLSLEGRGLRPGHTPSTIASPPSACSIRPAAPATSSMSRWS